MIRLAGLDERLRAHAEATLAYAESQGLKPVVVSVRRDYTDQAKLYQNYLAGKSRWPAAPPGQSAHQYGVAFDATVPPDDMPLWIQIRRLFGWHVVEGDAPHAEYPGWSQYRQYLRYS